MKNRISVKFLNLILIITLGCSVATAQSVITRPQSEPEPDTTPVQKPKPKKAVIPIAKPSAASVKVDDIGFVDLGLSSYWGVANIGVSEPWESGYLYFWARVPEEIWSVPDLKTFEELVDKCTWTWSSLNSVYGYQVKASNGNSIFLPAYGEYGGKVDNRFTNWLNYDYGHYLVFKENNKQDGYEPYYFKFAQPQKGFYPLGNNYKDTDPSSPNYYKDYLRPVISKEMYKLYNKAKEGDVASIAELGYKLQEQHKDKLADKYFKQAIEKGDINLAMKLGREYSQSKNIDSLLKAYNWMSIPLSKPENQYKESTSAVKRINKITKDDWDLYLDIIHDIGVYYAAQKNYQEALKWFLEASNLGSAEAKNTCGIYYSRGWGTSQNLKLGFDYFKKAAEMGNVDAEFNLGLDYYNGYGVEKNIDIAHKWVSLAAKHGNESAKDFLKKNLTPHIITISEGKGKDDALIGATFIQYRNGHKLKAMATDLDGNVVVYDIRPGDEFELQYVGFKTLKVENKAKNFPEKYTFIMHPGSHKKTETIVVN